MQLEQEKPAKPLRNEKGHLLPGQVLNPLGRIGNTDNPREKITEETLEKLEEMSKDELIKLIRKVGGAMFGVGLLNDDEAFEAVKLKLLNMGLSYESASNSLPSLKEWADRAKGKAVQSVSMKIENDPLSKISTERLLRLEQELARMTGQEAIIIPPMPEKIGARTQATPEIKQITAACEPLHAVYTQPEVMNELKIPEKIKRGRPKKLKPSGLSKYPRIKR